MKNDDTFSDDDERFDTTPNGSHCRCCPVPPKIIIWLQIREREDTHSSVCLFPLLQILITAANNDNKNLGMEVHLVVQQ
jgi:hypothetical protein